MRKVPVTRFRREIRKWLRKGECISITRNGKVICVLLDVDTYNIMLKINS